jgi:hypothetical protein
VLDEGQFQGHVSTIIPRERANERRDIQRTIDLWQRNMAEGSALLDVGTFDFSPMKRDWGHRFLICSDLNLENAAFVMYGVKFAQLLDLPITSRSALTSLAHDRSASPTPISPDTVDWTVALTPCRARCCAMSAPGTSPWPCGPALSR